MVRRIVNETTQHHVISKKAMGHGMAIIIKNQGTTTPLFQLQQPNHPLNNTYAIEIYGMVVSSGNLLQPCTPYQYKTTVVVHMH